jgi:lambda family phage tail tape measure protein
VGNYVNQTAVVVTADMSGYVSSMETGRRQAAAFVQSQEQAAARTRVAQQAITEAAQNGSNASAKAINNFVSQLARTADQAGKTRAELLQMKAAQLGIAESVSGYIGQIDEASKHTHGFNIATSGARRELLVLAHEASQGNWSKFGGSLMVLGERTDALSAIMSSAGVGVGLFVAAIAGAGYEIYKTITAINALDTASKVTNGYLGLTNDQLATMAQQLASANGGLVEASNTMAALTRTGHASADTLAELTTVVTQFGKDVGLSADKAAEAFVKMLDDPKKGMAELQAQYHTFSAAQVQVIDGYIKTGDTAQATKAFIDAVAESQHRMAAQGTQEVGILAKLWQSFADAAKQAGDNFDRMGVAATNAEKLTDALNRQQAAQRNLAQAKAMPFGNTGSAQAELDAANAQVAALQKVQAAQKKLADDNEKRAKSGDAKIAVDKYLDSSKYANPKQQHTNELNAENADFKRATADLDKNSADYQAALKRHYENVAQIDEQYAKKTRTKSNNGVITAQMAQMAADNAALEDQRKSALAQAKADYDTGRRSYEDYYASVRDINVKFLTEEIDNAAKREDIAKGKKEQAAAVQAHKDWQKLIDERKRAEQDYTNALETYAQKRTANVQKYGQQEAAALLRQQDGYANADNTRFSTSQMKSDYDARAQIVAQYNQQVTALKEQYDSPTADQQEYTLKLQQATQYFDLRLAALEDHLAKEQQVRESYTDQMHSAIVKIGGDGQTNAQLVATAFTTTWQDMSSALDTFVTTGKGSFSQFAASVLSDMAKIALHAAEMQIFQAIGMSAFSTGGDVGHYADGGSIVGAGTGTSDSIPAMLSNGEYVIRASQAKKYHSLLESINNGHMSHFATGGPVGAMPSSSGAPSGGSPVSVVVNNNGGGGLTDTDAKELHTLVSAFVDKRMGQAMRGQGGYAYQMRYNQI